MEKVVMLRDSLVRKSNFITIIFIIRVKNKKASSVVVGMGLFTPCLFTVAQNKLRGFNQHGKVLSKSKQLV